MSSWKASTGVRAQLNPRGEDEVADADYVNFIRRFPPSKLVSLVAAVAPDYAFNQADYATNNLITPWGLADVTRVSLTFSNEYRAAEPTVEDLLTCLDMHNRLGHPGLKAQEPDAAANTVLQLAFYQFPFQRPAAFLTGRSIALFEQTLFPDPSEVEVMHSDWQNDLLGCTLSEYTGVTQLLAAAAKPNGGRFDPAWIEKPELQDLTDIFDPTITRRMLTKFLAAPASGFRQRDPERSSIGRRFTFNPLVEFPVVSGLGSDLLMPVPDFVLRKPTPSGLYFTTSENCSRPTSDATWHLSRALPFIPRSSTARTRPSRSTGSSFFPTSCYSWRSSWRGPNKPFSQVPRGRPRPYALRSTRPTSNSTPPTS